MSETHASPSHQPGKRPNGTAQMTDLTRLVGERKHIELQLLKLDQALSALQTDANLSGALSPDKGVSEDAQSSMAAIEVMMSALKQRKIRVNSDIEAARHRRHDAALEMQEQREQRILEESERTMKEHITMSTRRNDLSRMEARRRNEGHQSRVTGMWITKQNGLRRAAGDLQAQIKKREKREQEKKEERVAERQKRYEEYCIMERERSSRLLKLEALRTEHHSGINNSRSHSDTSSMQDTSRGVGRAISTVRYLRAERPRPESKGEDDGDTSVAISIPTCPDIHKRLDARQAMYDQRRALYEKVKISKVTTRRAEFEKMTLMNKISLGDESLTKSKALLRQMKVRSNQIEDLKKEQQAHTEALRLEKAMRANEILRRSKIKPADLRWSQRAQRLLDSVCQEISPNDLEDDES